MTDSSPEISRVPRSTEEARATYDRLAPVYDWIEGHWGRRARQAGLEILNACAGERILETGCGTGCTLVQIARAVGHQGRADGLDISPRMVEITRRRPSQAGVADQSNVEDGDVLKADLERAAYDGGFMSFTLELFDTPEIPRVLRRCRRALRHRGRLCVVSLTKSGPSTRMQRVYEWAHARWPKLLDCRPIYVERTLSRADFDVEEAETLRLWGLPIAIVLGRSP